MNIENGVSTTKKERLPWLPASKSDKAEPKNCSKNNSNQTISEDAKHGYLTYQRKLNLCARIRSIYSFSYRSVGCQFQQWILLSCSSTSKIRQKSMQYQAISDVKSIAITIHWLSKMMFNVLVIPNSWKKTLQILNCHCPFSHRTHIWKYGVRKWPVHNKLLPTGF